MKNICEKCGKKKIYIVFDAENDKIRYFCLRHLAEFTNIPMMDLSNETIMADRTAHLNNQNEVPILYVEWLSEDG